jgi:hypothetical protein
VLKVANPSVEEVTSGGAGQTVITLALKPAEAQQLVFAQEVGTVWFSLIGPGDQAPNTPPVRLLQVVR